MRIYRNCPRTSRRGVGAVLKKTLWHLTAANDASYCSVSLTLVLRDHLRLHPEELIRDGPSNWVHPASATTMGRLAWRSRAAAPRHSRANIAFARAGNWTRCQYFGPAALSLENPQLRTNDLRKGRSTKFFCYRVPTFWTTSRYTRKTPRIATPSPIEWPLRALSSNTYARARRTARSATIASRDATAPASSKSNSEAGPSSPGYSSGAYINKQFVVNGFLQALYVPLQHRKLDDTMKWFQTFVTLFAVQLVAAAPELAKRATANDVATLGYGKSHFSLHADTNSLVYSDLERRVCHFFLSNSITSHLSNSTTGGSGGTQTTVTTLAALTSAIAGSAKKIVFIQGTITGNVVVRPGPNTSIIGKTGSSLVGVGIRIIDVNNVIVRNVKISKVLAEAGDALAVQAAHQVWIDHVDLSSDRDHDKDFYDGLLDLTHGVTGITVTNSKLYTHWKGSLIGHSDSNGAEDTPITVTMASNYWFNLSSRTPSFRFGHGHIFNNVFDNNDDGINTRDGAQLLVENNVWTGTDKPLYSTNAGFAVATGNDFGGAANTAPAGSFTAPPYSYSKLAASAVRAAVVSTAGQTLAF
ncbi:Polysaccharide lyase family 1 protein [Mycena kentingensis (nom. inval.)]|nr:Polysaccharide lyase family 1 protein [Mycena kentingensis (nom. inval.)]